MVYAPYFTYATETNWMWFLDDPVPFTIGDWVTPPDPQFIPGDVNNDQLVNIADVTALIDYLLDNTKEINLLAANMNGDDAINIADVTALIDYLLNQGE